MSYAIAPVDPTRPWTATRIVEIQQAAYAVEAELMGFDGIPPLHETPAQVTMLDVVHWRGAFEDDVLVGIIAWDATDVVADIDRLAVDPARSRRGHGRRLVQSVPEIERVTVSTGRANEPALRLYLSLGFEEIGHTEIAPGIFTTQLQLQTRSEPV